MFYWAIVHHDEGSAFGVSFPDLPDCFAAADDERDIMKNAIAALDDYFSDGHEAPTAMSLNEVKREVKEDLAEGAYLIQVPVIPLTSKSVRVNLSMDSGLLAAIDDAASRLGLNRSAFIAQAARREIEAA